MKRVRGGTPSELAAMLGNCYYTRKSYLHYQIFKVSLFGNALPSDDLTPYKKDTDAFIHLAVLSNYRNNVFFANVLLSNTFPSRPALLVYSLIKVFMCFLEDG